MAPLIGLRANLAICVMWHTNNAGWGGELPKYDFSEGFLPHPYRRMQARRQIEKEKLYRKQQARAARRAWISAYTTGNIVENPHTLNSWTRRRTGVGPTQVAIDERAIAIMAAFEAYKAAGDRRGGFVFDEEGLEERQRHAARARGLDERRVRQRRPHLAVQQLVRR